MRKWKRPFMPAAMVGAIVSAAPPAAAAASSVVVPIDAALATSRSPNASPR
jgi:hypothetical protein